MGTSSGRLTDITVIERVTLLGVLGTDILVLTKSATESTFFHNFQIKYI